MASRTVFFNSPFRLQKTQGTLTLLRGYIKQLVREGSSSSSAEPKGDRMRIGDIRWLCQTHEAPRLFQKLRELPEKHLADSVSSALYWFLYYDKIEEALEFKNLVDKYGISKTHSTYSTLAALYSKCGQLVKDLHKEMVRDGLTPKTRHYAPFVEAAVQKGDLLTAFDSLNEMQNSAVVFERNMDVYTSLITACAQQQNSQLSKKVLEIFRDFAKHRDSLSIDTLRAIKIWFDSQVRPKWKTSWSTASATFRCQVCQQKLETGEFSAAELEELKHPLVSLLWKDCKPLPSVECFTSAGKYIDYFQKGQMNNFPQSVEKFIRRTGQYDIVIDGLNVAYFKGFFDPGKVENMVDHFVKQRKRILVLGCSPMKLQPRGHGEMQTPLAKLMDYLIDREHCGVFCLKESSIDDVYLISAAMHCGPGTRLVSCDRFSDHISRMDPLMKAQFRRWQNLYQMVLEKFVGNEPVFVNKKPFDAAAQSTGDSWHFPSSDKVQWLCARKTGILE